jgi:hypothetical protein
MHSLCCLLCLLSTVRSTQPNLPAYFATRRASPKRSGPGTFPDGALAAVERIVDRDAYVVEWTKRLGRGPWIFPIADLVLVS